MNQLITIFKIPELRNKILFTLGLLAIYRLGFFIPLPIVDQEAVRAWQENMAKGGAGRMLDTVAMFSGSQIGANTIFGLGIMPYISASIIFQLLASAIPALEKLQKEGEVGRKKINEYTRYATVALCILQSIFWVRFMMEQKAGDRFVVAEQYQTFFHGFVCIWIMTAGTMFLMWLGEQIDEYGIGNGISLIIMAGIVGRIPKALAAIAKGIHDAGGVKWAPDSGIGLDKLLILAMLFVGVIWVVILITQGQRRILIQSAKHQGGRRSAIASRTYLPLRVNQAGVMPIIFASSLLIFPTIVLDQLAKLVSWDWVFQAQRSLVNQGFLYTIFEITLIYFFCYYWTAITFNPKDMADNLKDMGAFIPGYRPGKRTADYLEKVMMRVTYVGAAFLAVISIIPMVLTNYFNIPGTVAGFFGGTGLLILISVALDLVQKIDNHLIVRNYDSLLSAGQAGG
jgi:preprotein translocase subunit SecY